MSPSSHVFALKWRPKIFADLVGQEVVTRILQNALRSGRIANAYIFYGPRGVGKTTCARIFAKVLSCRNPKGAEPCNTCEICEEVNEGSSLDVIEIDSAAFNRVEDMRSLQETVGTSPAKGKYKVYIFDEAHRITPQAFDVFLKTLEEPPAHVIFILASTEIHKFPATVQSRCQRLEFRAMNMETLTRQLERIAQAEGLEVEKGAFHLIARSAGGSMRDAQRTLDQLAAYSGKKIRVQDVQQMLGWVEGEVFLEILDFAVRGQAGRVFDTLRRVRESGCDLIHFYTGLMETFHHFCIAKAYPKEQAAQVLELPQAEKDAVLEKAPALSDAFLLSGLRLLIESEWNVRHSLHPEVVLESLLYELCRLRDLIGVDDLLSGQGPSPAGGKDVSSTAGEPRMIVEEIVEPEEGDSAELTAIKSNWREIIEEAGKRKMALSGLLRDVFPKTIDQGVLVLQCKSAFHQENVQQQENKEILEQSIRQVTGVTVETVAVLKEGAPGQAKPEKKAAPKPLVSSEKVTEIEKEEPLVKAVRDFFGAEVVEIKRHKN